MTQLQLTVEPQYFEQNLDYQHRRNFTLVPYRNKDALALVPKFGIKLPFKEIVTTADGRSVCDRCGAVYVGYQPMCDRQVRFVHVQDGYHSRDIHSETANIGDRINLYGGYHTYPVVSDKQDVCKGNLKWDLQAEFDKQSRFFTLLEYISQANTHNPFDEFSDCFLPGVQQHLEARLTKAAVEMLTNQVSRHHGALEQIAQKMQHAGQALCF